MNAASSTRNAYHSVYKLIESPEIYPKGSGPRELMKTWHKVPWRHVKASNQGVQT